MDKGGTQQRYPVSFTGTGGQFFKIWIVNIMLTILTLYIYSAWAKVRTKRYFYGNTVLDGSSFEYHAKPLQILLSRMIAAVLLIAVTVGGALNPFAPVIATIILFLIIPWAIWRSTKFNMRMTSYRNVRFGFEGSVWPLYLFQLVLPIIVYALGALGIYLWAEFEFAFYLAAIWIAAVFVLNLLLTAFTHKHLSSYFLNGYRYGKSQFSGELSLGSFFKAYLMATCLALGTLAALVIPLLITSMPSGVGILDWIDSLFEMLDEDNEGSEAAVSFIVKSVFFLYVYLFVVGYYIAALISSRVRNHVFSRANLDNRVNFESTVTTTGLWWVMFSNVLLIFLSLGFARPYTQVRMAKYLARSSTVLSAEPLDEFIGEKRQEVGAFGDELGDAFDMDMDVGF